MAFWERLPPAIPSPGVSGGVFWTLLRCTDTATAVAYYQDVCGWSFQHPSAEVALTGGSQFGLSLVVGIDKPLVCVAVADLEQTCAGVREAGGQVRLDSQAAMVAHGLPRSDSPCALMTDLEGHQLALVQSF